MKEVKLDELRAGMLHVSLVERDQGLHLVWTGESDARDPRSALTPFLVRILPALDGRSLRVTFLDLKYMNSSSVTPIMEFLQQARTHATHVSVIYRNNLPWQATSFRAMRVVARKWSNVEVVGE